MGLYLFGIVRPIDRGSWQPPAGLTAIPHEDLLALVKPLDATTSVLEVTAAYMHMRVLEEAAAGATVLPCSFGTVADGEEQVRVLLRRAHADLQAAMDRVAGKEEAGLKAFWKKEALNREIERELGNLEALRDKVRDPAEERQIAIVVGQHVEAVLERWKATLTPLLCTELRPFCTDIRVNEPIGHRMLVNLAFLVDRGHEWALREKVHQLDVRYGDRLDFRYVSGLPPYNFVDLRISFPDCGRWGGDTNWKRPVKQD